MSNEITRFNHVTDWGMERDSDGDYVLHSDHEAVVDSMTAALVKLDGACLASEQEVARLRDEVERLRLVISQVTECLCDTLHERGGWAIEEVIDMGREAAMGASA